MSSEDDDTRLKASKDDPAKNAAPAAPSHKETPLSLILPHTANS